MSQSSGAEMGFGLRLLIILFGVGIVALGLEPFRVRYGGIWNYLSKETTKLVGSSEFLKRSWDNISTSGRELKAKLETPGPIAAPVRGLTEGGAKDSSAKERTVDQLSNKDRKELDRLVNDLN